MPLPEIWPNKDKLRNLGACSSSNSGRALSFPRKSPKRCFKDSASEAGDGVLESFELMKV